MNVRRRGVAVWLESLVVAVLAAALFGSLLASDVFADPDSFYHAKMALLIRDQGVVREFPWLPFTELARHYADQHFLYHVFLIPFVAFPSGPLVGLKIATVVLGAGFAWTFYLVLRRLNLSGALPATLVLLAVSPLTFRLALAKGNGFALILLLLSLDCVFHYRPKLLALLTFLFVWSYGGFPLLIVAAGLFLVAAFIRDRVERRHLLSGVLARLFPSSFAHPRSHPHAWRLFLAAVAGALAGLVINPYFPNNLPFLFNQLIRIGIVNYREKIGVGGEWYPYLPMDLLTNTIILSVPLLIALIVFLWTTRRQSRRSWTLLLFTAFLFLLTMKSRRYVEYYVPIGMFFTVSAFNDALRSVNLRDAARSAVRRLTRHWQSLVLSLLFAVYLVVMLPTIAVRDHVNEWKDLRSGFRQSQYAAAMSWLRSEAPRGAVVVHSDWDEFPLLFYQNDASRYVAGLDPTFLYTADPVRYQTWVAISTGTYQGDLRQGLRELEASYAFVDAEHRAMNDLMDANPGVVRQVYADGEATIYAVE